MRLISSLYLKIRASHFVGLIRDVVAVFNARTKLWNCNKVGKGVFVRGKVKVRNEGNIDIGDNVFIRGEAVRVELVAHPGAQLKISNRTALSSGSYIEAGQSITIGSFCLIAANVRILDSDFHDIQSRNFTTEGKSVVIGNRVWLGPNVVVLKGVTIGDNTIVTANSVVSHSLPANVIATGIPARVIRQMNPTDTLLTLNTTPHTRS